MRKYIHLIIVIFIAFTSCTKDDGDFLSSKIVLKEVTLEDGRIKLEWNRPYVQNFLYYMIYKTSTPFDIYANYNQSQAEITDAEQTVYYDDLSLDESIYYTVVVYSENNQLLVSNSQKFEPDGIIIFDNSPSDVVFCPQKNRLFVFISNKIYACNYDSMEIEDSVILGSSKNKASIGYYNGEYELYVGCSNGYLRIYNIDNMTEKANVYVGGIVNSAVLDRYDNLYVKTYLNYSGKIFSYKRSTMSLVNNSYNWYSETGKIKHFNFSDRIIEVSGSYTMVYYDHDNAGNITNSDYINNYDYPKSEEVFEIFPDDDRIITDRTGAIYNSNLTYISQLGDSYNDYYNNFYIGDYIYAASAVEKEIRLFSKSTYSLVNTYNTGLYPMYVFNDGNYLIVFGSNYNNYSIDLKYSIEKIVLNK